MAEILWGESFVQDVISKYVQIIEFPTNNPDFIPSLIPIFVGLVVLELYFGRYEDEHLGWNSAVSNSTLLITTGITLIFQLDLIHPASDPRSAVAYSVLALGTIILILNFYHLWPAELAFNLSSSFIAYTVTYITISVTYAGMMPVRNTFIAAGGVFLTFYAVFTGIKLMENSATASPSADGGGSR